MASAKAFLGDGVGQTPSGGSGSDCKVVIEPFLEVIESQTHADSSLPFNGPIDVAVAMREPTVSSRIARARAIARRLGRPRVTSDHFALDARARRVPVQVVINCRDEWLAADLPRPFQKPRPRARYVHLVRHHHFTAPKKKKKIHPVSPARGRLSCLTTGLPGGADISAAPTPAARPVRMAMRALRRLFRFKLDEDESTP